MSKKTKAPAPKKGKGKSKTSPATENKAPKANKKSVKEIVVKKIVYSKSREMDAYQNSNSF